MIPKLEAYIVSGIKDRTDKDSSFIDHPWKGSFNIDIVTYGCNLTLINVHILININILKSYENKGLFNNGSMMVSKDFLWLG